MKRLEYPQTNRYFTMAVFAVPPVAGSAVSFLYNGGAIWALVSILRGRCALSREPHFRATVAVLYVYSAAMIFSALINPNLKESVRSLVGLGSLMLFPFAYSTWRISDRKQIVDACLIGCAAASVGGLIYAMYQVHMVPYIWRAEGGAGNPLIFANVVALAGGISLIGAFQYRGWRRAALLGAFLASSLAVVYTVSRGPLVLVGVNVLLVAAIHMPRGRAAVPVIAALAAFAAIVVVFMMSDATLIERRLSATIDEFANLFQDGDLKSSTGVRAALWQAGIDLWLERPLFGHGAGNTRELLNLRVMEGFGMDLHFSHFHNVFVTTLVEGGLLALAGLLAMIAVPVYTAVRALSRTDRETVRFGATLLLVFFAMFVITGMTNIVLHHDIMDAVFMCCLAVGLFLTVGDDAPEAEVRSATPR